MSWAETLAVVVLSEIRGVAGDCDDFSLRACSLTLISVGHSVLTLQIPGLSSHEKGMLPCEWTFLWLIFEMKKLFFSKFWESGRDGLNRCSHVHCTLQPQMYLEGKARKTCRGIKLACFAFKQKIQDSDDERVEKLKRRINCWS